MNAHWKPTIAIQTTSALIPKDLSDAIEKQLQQLRQQREQPQRRQQHFHLTQITTAIVTYRNRPIIAWITRQITRYRDNRAYQDSNVII